MKNPLYSRPAKSEADVCFFCLRKAVSLAVHIEHYLVGRSSSRHSFREPKYVEYLLHPFLSEKARKAMAGDLTQSYVEIHGEEGGEKANEWLYQETVNSLEPLIFRREVFGHVFIFLLRIVGVFALGRCLRTGVVHFGHHCGLLCGVINRQRSSIAPAALNIIVAFTFASVLVRTSTPTEFDGTADGTRNSSARSKEPPATQLASAKHQPSSEPTPPQEDAGHAFTRRRPTPKPKAGEKNSAALPILLLNYIKQERIVEGDADGGSVNNSPSVKPPEVSARDGQRRLRLELRDGSEKGLYTVSLVDAKRTPLITKRVRSSDGKFLHVSLDLRGLPSRTYNISVSRDHYAPTEYLVVVR